MIVTKSRETDLTAVREAIRIFLQSLVKEMVADPSSINVTVVVGERTTIFKVDCSQCCLGQIIGSRGKNISAIRTLVSAMTARKGFRAVVEIPFFT